MKQFYSHKVSNEFKALAIDIRIEKSNHYLISNSIINFNHIVSAVQYNFTNSSFSSLHCGFLSKSQRCFTPESPS